jgi:hypothetical protein
MPWTDRIGHRFKLRGLKYSSAVVQAGRFGKAAAKLECRSQPFLRQLPSVPLTILPVRLPTRNRLIATLKNRMLGLVAQQPLMQTIAA